MEYYTDFHEVHQRTLQIIREQGFEKGFEHYQDHRAQYQNLSNKTEGREILLKSLIEILSEGERLHANQGLCTLSKTNEGLSITPELLEHCIGAVYMKIQLEKDPCRIHYIKPLAS
jgi:hypothetical protein